MTSGQVDGDRAIHRKRRIEIQQDGSLLEQKSDKVQCAAINGSVFVVPSASSITGSAFLDGAGGGYHPLLANLVSSPSKS